MTRDRYRTVTSKFYKYIGLRGKTLEQKARNFFKKGKIDTNWALCIILKFVYSQWEQADKKEITGVTVRNYTKGTKLFCEMGESCIS